MASFTLSIRQDRIVNLYTLGLLEPPQTPATKTDILQAVRLMGILQFFAIMSAYFHVFPNTSQPKKQNTQNTVSLRD